MNPLVARSSFRGLLLLSVAVCLFALQPQESHAQTPYSACGYVCHGVECVLFCSDSGEKVMLDNFGTFRVGAYVRVSGMLEGCFSTCMEGIGCLNANTIALCSTCCSGRTGNADGSPDGVVDISDVLAVVSYLAAGVPLPGCLAESDVDTDGTVDIADISMLIGYLVYDTPLPMCP